MGKKIVVDLHKYSKKHKNLILTLIDGFQGDHIILATATSKKNEVKESVRVKRAGIPFHEYKVFFTDDDLFFEESLYATFIEDMNPDLIITAAPSVWHFCRGRTVVI